MVSAPLSSYLGIDFGTSGARAIAIDTQETIQAQIHYPFNQQTPQIWQAALFYLLQNLPLNVRKSLQRIAINGTSATVLLCDNFGNPVTAPLLYNDSRGVQVLEKIRPIAPPEHLVLSATSSLAKLFWWWETGVYSPGRYFLHQADWLAFLLHGQLGISDYHNALKLGYDVGDLRYPDWFPDVPGLPTVLTPGTPVGTITPEISQKFDIPAHCLVCAGTTDSIAAFLASGVRQRGASVTSLGSTLVLKLLSQTRVDDSRYGIYSHRFGDLWLTGGASNTGGAVLRHFFGDEELARLSQGIDSNLSSRFHYYPLLKPGDRFPVNDPHLLPRLEPRPEHPGEFLQGLLESIARIEALGYGKLQELGADPLKIVYTAGGGAKNLTWQRIRERLLGVTVMVSPQTEAAYGTALLAKQGLVGC